jgi:hypothetical protein
MIAAAGADELKLAGIAAFCPAAYDADRLAPQEGHRAMPRLTGKRKCHDTLRADTQPRITPMVRAVRRGAGAWKESRAGTGLDVKVSGTAHSTHS